MADRQQTRKWEPMVQNNSTPSSLRDVYRTIYRQKWKAGGFFLLIMVAVTAYTVLCPRSYESVGKLFVRVGRENAVLDPTATLGREPLVTVPVPETRENEIYTLVELLQSRPVVEHVVDTLGPARILDAQQNAAAGGVEADVAAPQSRQASRGDLGSAIADLSYRVEQFSPNPAEPRSDREKGITVVSKGLNVTPVRKSSVVHVSFESRSPELSQAVVSAVIAFSVDQHARLNRTEGASDFFAEQKAKMLADLTRRKNALRDLRNQTGPVSLDGQREVIVKRMSRLEDELSGTLSAIAAHQAKIEAVSGKLDAAPKTEVSEYRTGIGNDGTDEIRAQFYTLQTREQEAVAKLTDAHPKMQTIREQIDAARETLDKEPLERTHALKAPGRVYQAAELILLEEEPLLAWHEAKRNSLEGELLAVGEQWKALNDHDLQVAALQQEVELCQANYLRYAKNFEQTRIDQALQWEKISNISVLQPATYDAKAIRPRKLVNLTFGFLVATFGALALALLVDVRDRPFVTPDEVEANLELPTLVSIPRFKRKQLSPNGRK